MSEKLNSPNSNEIVKKSLASNISFEKKDTLDQNISNEIVKGMAKNNQNIINFFWSWRAWIEIKNDSLKQMWRWLDGKMIYFWKIWLKYLDWKTASKQTWIFVNEDWEPMNMVIATSNNWSTYISNFWLQLSETEFLNAPLNSLKNMLANMLYSSGWMYLWEYLNSRGVKNAPKDLDLKILQLIKSLPAQTLKDDMMSFMRADEFENTQEFKKSKENLFRFLDKYWIYKLK